MIDIITNETRDLKNITQIGTPTPGEKIYIEDAAYTRIHMEEFQEQRVFVLMGHTECADHVYTTFIEAAIPVMDIQFDKNTPVWTNTVWSGVFHEIKESYEKLIVIGWAIDRKGIAPRITSEIEAIHREYFGGVHQLLFLVNTEDSEEYFYLSKNNHLYQKEGFYIYYQSGKQRIPQLQNNLSDDVSPVRVHALPGIERSSRERLPRDRFSPESSYTGSSGKREEAQASVMVEHQPSGGQYRKMLLSRDNPSVSESRSPIGGFLALTAVALLAAVLGTALLKNPGQAQKVESALSALSRKVTEKGITLLPPETETEDKSVTETDDGQIPSESGSEEKDPPTEQNGGDGASSSTESTTETAYVPVEKVDGGIPQEK